MKLYISLLYIKDPTEMLSTLRKLRESSLDYTLLSQYGIGIRPSDLYKAIKTLEISKGIDCTLYTPNGNSVSGIYMKSLNIDAHQAVYYVSGVGNITISGEDVVVLPFKSSKEDILLEYAGFLGFEAR